MILTKKLKSWQNIEFKVTIKTDEDGKIFDINVSNYPYPLNSISFDELDYIPRIIIELLEDCA